LGCCASFPLRPIPKQSEGMNPVPLQQKPLDKLRGFFMPLMLLLLLDLPFIGNFRDPSNQTLWNGQWLYYYLQSSGIRRPWDLCFATPLGPSLLVFSLFAVYRWF
tara:strand:+ start:80 stop:394 length:315 start_codon:yes stop_codon:yes gene_type:complete